MRKIAESLIEEAMRTYAPRPGGKKFHLAGNEATILLGLGSAIMYALLYHYDAVIRHLAEATYQGQKTLFFLPIVIAFAFSVVHGSFTDHFWASVGLKPKS